MRTPDSNGQTTRSAPTWAQVDIEDLVAAPVAVYLERVDADRNLARFYALRIEPTLFGDWALICRWGRIGARGQQQEQWWSTHGEAARALASHQAAKERRGYRAYNRS